MSAERTAALDACARQPGAELTYPFGEQAAVFKVAGKIFAIVGLIEDSFDLVAPVER